MAHQMPQFHVVVSVNRGIGGESLAGSGFDNEQPDETLNDHDRFLSKSSETHAGE